MADDEWDLTGTLFNVQVAKVEAVKIRAEEDKFSRYVALVPHFGKNDGNHWLLDEFEVSMAQTWLTGRG
jgi:hypothetical protein